MSINSWYRSIVEYSRDNTDPKKEREAAIFQAACHVIRRKGFHQARIIDIARRAGISYGLVYHYFRSKSDLFNAIFNEWWTNLFAEMDRLESKYGSIEQRLAGLVDYFFDLYENRPDLLNIFITEFSRSTTNLTPEHLESFKLFFSRTEKLMAEAQSEGTLRDDVRPRYFMYVFFGSLEGLLSAMVFENQPMKSRAQRKRITQGLLEVFFNGARARQG
jgi:TetR/AcrR family fatty acid metabolism transcriptional regulator